MEIMCFVLRSFTRSLSALLCALALFCGVGASAQQRSWDTDGNGRLTIGELAYYIDQAKSGNKPLCVSELSLLATACVNDARIYTTTHPDLPDLSGTAISGSKPLEWSKPSDILPDNRMSITFIENVFPTKVGAGDMLAAFINGECRGVVKAPFLSSDGLYTFNLSIFGLPASSAMRIYYYSALQGGVYISLPLSYEQGGMIKVDGNSRSMEWE